MLRDDQIQPTLPQGTGEFTGQDPATMEEMFNPSRGQPPQGMPQPGGGEVQVAASGNVPLPARGDMEAPGPGMPERAPSQQLGGLTQPDDTRYKDPQNLIMGNVIMGGMLPWVQAASDVAQGRVPAEKFDEARMEHERRIEELNEQHPDFKSAAEKAAPFIIGLTTGIVGPAKTVVGTMARGAGTAAPLGAARGYSSGPVEEPSLSAERAGRAVGGAATDAAIGAGGAAVPSIVAGAKSLIGKATSIVAERAASKVELAKTQKLDAEAKSVADASAAKKAGTAAKAAETRQRKAMDKQFEQRTKAENTEFQAQYKRHTAMPEGPSKFWAENRKQFVSDPVHAFNEVASKGLGLEGMAKALNLPASVIVSRMAGKKLTLDTPAHEKLFKEMLDADRVATEFKKRGLDVRGTTDGPAGRPTTAPAGKSTTKRASGKPASTPSSSRSGWTPGDIKPGEPDAPKPKRKPKS